jgi:hypothetical protein
MQNDERKHTTRLIDHSLHEFRRSLSYSLATIIFLQLFAVGSLRDRFGDRFQVANCSISDNNVNHGGNGRRIICASVDLENYENCNRLRAPFPSPPLPAPLLVD